jgi:hypothetical protein
MGLKINGSTSGSIEIDVPAVAGTDTSITIPAKNGGTFIVEESTGNIDLGPLDINGSAADDSVNIDSSGRLLVGTATARNTFFNDTSITPVFQVEGANSATDRFISQTYGSSGGDNGIFVFAKHRSNSKGGITVVQADDGLGQIDFQGSDGTNFVSSARIRALVDGTPGADDMPGRLEFSTTADGASSPTERMRIAQNGRINMYDVYGTAIGGTTRDLYIESTGQLGYLTSTAKTKTNIQDVADVSWLYSLNVKSFNYKLRDEKGDLTEQANPEIEYGLIAEEVEEIAPELCFYNETPNGLELEGVTYRKLVAPMLKALQQSQVRIEQLEANNASLEARLAALEGGAA